MNQKQILGFVIIGVIAFICIRFLPGILGFAFNLAGLLISLAIIGVIGYALYSFFLRGKI